MWDNCSFANCSYGFAFATNLNTLNSLAGSGQEKGPYNNTITNSRFDDINRHAMPISKSADQKRGTTDWAGNIRGLDNLRNYLYSADTDLERLKACTINLEKLDKVRGNSYIKSLPILKEMFDECL